MSRGKKEVSVIIPTYNRAESLKECLVTAMRQLDPGSEIIVVDNGSTDRTKEAVKVFGGTVRYFFEPRRGPSYARNLGLKKAKGEIVAFLDDDCLVSANWLRSIKKTIARQGSRNVYQGRINHQYKERNWLSEIFFWRNKIAWAKIKKSRGWKMGRYLNFLSAGNFFLRKKVLEDVGGFDAKIFPFIGEERDLAYRLQLAGYRIIYAPKVAVTHFKERASLLKSFKAAFYYGRAQGILEERYLAEAKVRQLFTVKKQDNELFLNKILTYFLKKNLLSGWLQLAFFALRKMLYDIGVYYGRILGQDRWRK